MALGPSDQALTIFVSYSRRDSDATDALAQALQDSGFNVVIDRRALPFGEEWQKQLAGFIQECDTVVWLVSPHSVKSKWCNWELGLAQRLSKRLVPVRIVATDSDLLPKALGKFHILPAERTFVADEHYATLVETLHADWGWLKQGTALAERARQWLGTPLPLEFEDDPGDIPTASFQPKNSPNIDRSALLHGRQLADAEAWRLRQPSRAPAPGQAVLDLILASRQAANKRQRWLVAAALAVAGIAFAGAGGVWIQRNQAIEQRDNALSNESRLYAQQADRDISDGDHVTASLKALAGLRDERGSATARVRPYVANAELSLFVARQKQLEQALLSTEGLVADAAFAPSGRLVATASEKVGAELWDALTFERVAQLGTHPIPARAVVFSPDGNKLLTLQGQSVDHSGNIAALWDVAKRTKIADLIGHELDIHIGRFSRDGKLVVTGAQDGSAHVWSAETGEKLRTFSGHDREPVRAMDFAPDGDTVVTGGSERVARTWSLKTATAIGAFEQEGDITSVEFSPDGRSLVTVGGETATIWDVRDAQRRHVLKGSDWVLDKAAFSPDGLTVATASSDGTVRLWDPETGLQRGPVLAGHRPGTVDIQFSQDGTWLITGSDDATARIWQVATGTTFAILKGHRDSINRVVLDPAGSTILTAADDGTARLWRTRSLEMAAPMGEDRRISSGHLSANGETAVIESSSGGAEVWDLRANSKPKALIGHVKPIIDAAVSGDGSLVITGSDDHTARIWDGRTGNCQHVLSEHASRVVSTGISSDGKWAVTAAHDGLTIVWDARTGEPHRRLPHDQGSIALAAFSPRDTLIATTGSDKSVLVWDWQNNAAPFPLDHECTVQSAAFNPDASRLATGCDNGRLTVWDLEKRLRVFSRTIQEAVWVKFIAYNPDGKRIVLIGQSNVARLIDAESGLTISDLSGRKRTDAIAEPGNRWGRTQRAMFSPWHDVLVTADNDGSMHIWSAKTGEERALLESNGGSIEALAIVGNQLTAVSTSGTAYMRTFFATAQELVDDAKAALPRCLTGVQAASAGLPASPPDWCITGSEHQAVPGDWRPRWPYQTEVWRQWLLESRAGAASRPPPDASIAKGTLPPVE